jgi:hypothetical protein
LEKKLIELEFKLANVNDNGEEFKKLCKTGVLCEERWGKILFCVENFEEDGNLFVYYHKSPS